VDALASVGGYTGSARRFELKWEVDGILIYDDYAHHHTEIKATLAAARQLHPNRRIWAVAQPHTFSRTRMIAPHLAQAFGDADEVILVDIYAAREQDDGTISSADIVNASRHKSIRHIGALDAAAEYVAQRIQPGDLLITLGAGDSDKVGEMVWRTLQTRTVQQEATSS
jgi:UDP-N-acetylmuramate--alanine ligase